MNSIKNIFDFSLIRLFKLLEINQYMLISFFLTLLLGSFINRLFPILDENKSTLRLLFEITYQLLFMTTSIYYIKKISSNIPFLFKPFLSYYNIPYIPSKKNESMYGIILGTSFMIDNHVRLNNKIKEVTNRF